MKDGKIQLVINTPTGRIPREDEVKIRSQVILYNIPYTTTISGAQATVSGIEAFLKNDLEVKPLQEYHKKQVAKDCQRLPKIIRGCKKYGKDKHKNR